MNLGDKSALFLATGAGVGNIPLAPGTFGSLAGLPISFLLSGVSLSLGLILTVLLVFFAVIVSDKAARLIGARDPGRIVIDEVAGMVVTLLGVSFDLMTVIAGFAIFRILDIWKPFPVRWADRNLSGGIGIVADDVLAGLIGNLVLRIIHVL